MKTLDLDVPLKPLLTVKIGGQAYSVTDIDPSLATAMTALGDDDPKEALDEMYNLISEAVGAKKDVVAKLGLRKINLLMRTLLDAIQEETQRVEEEAKNVPGVVAQPNTSSPRPSPDSSPDKS